MSDRKVIIDSKIGTLFDEVLDDFEMTVCGCLSDRIIIIDLKIYALFDEILDHFEMSIYTFRSDITGLKISFRH
jgi:hypothetical protein